MSAGVMGGRLVGMCVGSEGQSSQAGLANLCSQE